MIFQLVSISITSATPSKLTPEIKPDNLSVPYHTTKTPTGVAGEFNLDEADPFIHYFGTDAVYCIVITLTPDFTEGDKLNLKVTANSSAFTCQVRVEKTLNAYAYVVFRGGMWQVINLEDFYQVALEWSAPYAAEPKPKLFSLGAWNIANPIVAFGSETLSKPSFKSELEALLVTLCRTAANLGLNTAILGRWSPNGSDVYLTSTKVNQIADAAGIRKRVAADVQPIPHPLRQGGRKSEEPTYPSDFIFDLISAHTNADGTVAYDLYFGGLYYTGMLTQALDAKPLPNVPPRSPLQTRVQEAISFIQNNFALDAAELPALERINLYDEPSICLQNLAPGFREAPAFVRCLDYASTAQLPDTGPLQFLKRCFQDQGQLAGSLYEGLAIEIGLFRQAYLTYLKMVNSSPLFFGFSNWDLVSPPAAFLAGDVPVQRAGDAASRRLHYWTLRFLHAQISEGWAAQSIALNKQLKSLGHPTGCYSHVTDNGKFGCTHVINGAPPQPAGPQTPPEAESRSSNLYPDWFSDSRANLGLRAKGYKEFVGCPEDDETIGVDLHLVTAKAALLRSASLVGTEAGTALSMRVTNLGVNPDELIYRALAFVGNGVKSIDYFNFQGNPDGGDYWCTLKAPYIPRSPPSAAF